MQGSQKKQGGITTICAQHGENTIQNQWKYFEGEKQVASTLMQWTLTNNLDTSL